MAGCCKNTVLDVKVMYHNKDLIQIEKIEIGDWIDLRSAEDVSMKEGEAKLINLGVSIQAPEGYEMLLVPRSSTFKNFGLIQTNSIGVIDESYSGPKDIIKLPVLAVRDTTINFNDRICQFRFMKKQPKLNLITVDTLDNANRGGFGSTGVL